jgi:hypothetical protein
MNLENQKKPQAITRTAFVDASIDTPTYLGLAYPLQFH